MLVFFEENLAILANTKTGSTALHASLAPFASVTLRQPPALKHMSVKKFQRILKPNLVELGARHNLETFCIIRHPIDWLSSWFRYRCRDELIGHPNSTRDVTFNEFVEDYLRAQPQPFSDVGSQSQFLIGTDGQVGIDHLFRYDARTTYSAFLQKKLGRTFETKELNVSPKFNVNLDPHLKARLQTERRIDFDLWSIAQT